MAKVLNNKQKELIFRFHIKDATMTELANELGVAPKAAYDVYKQFIVDIIRDFKKSGYINISYGKQAEPKSKPVPMEPELPPEEDEEDEEEEDEEEEDDEDEEEEPAKVKAKVEPVEEEIQPAPAPQVEGPPKVKIPIGIVNGLIKEDRPLVIESNDFAGIVATYINDDGKVPQLTNPEELPEISIATRDVIEKYCWNPSYLSDLSMMQIRTL